MGSNTKPGLNHEAYDRESGVSHKLKTSSFECWLASGGRDPTLNPISPTYSLHCSSFWGLPFRILNIDLVKPKKGTTMETTGTL